MIFFNNYLKSLEFLFSFTKLRKETINFRVGLLLEFHEIKSKFEGCDGFFFQTTIFGNIRHAPILQRNLSLGKLNTCHHMCIDPALLSVPSSRDPFISPRPLAPVALCLHPRQDCSLLTAPPEILAEVRARAFHHQG